ncbi:MAG TPA: sugar transferase [Pseudobdellovibrionaceae bacterium]|nr:sugar transferase [Pseudobdellovibrionaceae bacterium]
MDSIRHAKNRQVKLLLFDFAAAATAYTAAYAIRMGELPQEFLTSLPIMSFVWINALSLYVADVYGVDPLEAPWKKPLQTFVTACVAGGLYVALIYAFGSKEFSGVTGRGVLMGGEFAFATLASLARYLAWRSALREARRARWIFIGTEDSLTPWLKDLAARPVAGSFEVYLPQVSEAWRTNLQSLRSSEVRLKGSWTDIEAQLPQISPHEIAGLVVAVRSSTAREISLSESMLDRLMRARLQGVRVLDLADFYENVWRKVPVFYLERGWFALSGGFQLLHNPMGFRLKRLMDLALASLLLVIAVPIMLIVMLLIKLESRGGAVYTQQRVGEGGRVFTIYKLRSMRSDSEARGAQWAKSHDARVTRIGRFIRATRIDELPQLFNVLRGDMSFIGPRPERPEFTGELEQKIPYYSLRHLLRPGITGWAQVMYPYGATVEDAREKLQFELYYIKNYSLILDAAIILRTIRVVVTGSGR